ncbi:NOL1/NOP2/sun family protein [Histomonas meleagridis]|uniref:NOL1/NOP2/sun family protein n=1 Tax=Histomonas meleagridis TaxID=135588 RepID=UPI00355A97F6|nr:NOL1/NOP2/sun family protein [Histomonas meleagridis]KAH0804403.1 NOL1/NOP2/sun family protein [Histomonas meleagridis]
MKKAEHNEGFKMKKKPIEVGSINDYFIEYYRNLLVPHHLSEDEFNKMIEISKTPLPNVFRLSNKCKNHTEIENQMNQYFATLQSHNVDAVEITGLGSEYGKIFKFSLDKATLRRDERFKSFRDWLNLQTKLGNCHRQEFVSMIPPYFLSIEKGDHVLDTCAAPGSKTAQILEMLDTTGLVIANDSDIKRCQPLVHQLQRVGTSNAMIVCQQAQHIDLKGELFDKVLCDVPCSGDGTIRKNGVAGYSWSPKNGGSKHGVQRVILKRGLELLKVGGICVYSTCSMNPIEDEAVINSVLLELNNCVEVVDVSDKYQQLKRHNGITDWVVYDTGNSNLETFYKTPEDVPENRKQFAPNTMFPQPQIQGLTNCMRFYPHDFDSGGFFVAVLRKVKDFEINNQYKKELKPLREAPYHPLNSVSQVICEQIKEIFGFKEDFPLDQLYVRDEKTVHNIYFLCKPLSELVNKFGSDAFRAVNCGSTIFTNIGTSKDEKGTIYPCKEGIPIVMKYATKRIFKVTPKDMKLLLEAGYNAIRYNELEKETEEIIEKTENKGAIFYIPETPFAYGGMTFKSTMSLFLRKDLLSVELEKLKLTFPELENEKEIIQ